MSYFFDEASYYHSFGSLNSAPQPTNDSAPEPLPPTRTIVDTRSSNTSDNANYDNTDSVESSVPTIPDQVPIETPTTLDPVTSALPDHYEHWEEQGQPELQHVADTFYNATSAPSAPVYIHGMTEVPQRAQVPQNFGSYDFPAPQDDNFPIEFPPTMTSDNTPSNQLSTATPTPLYSVPMAQLNPFEVQNRGELPAATHTYNSATTAQSAAIYMQGARNVPQQDFASYDFPAPKDGNFQTGYSQTAAFNVPFNQTSSFNSFNFDKTVSNASSSNWYPQQTASSTNALQRSRSNVQNQPLIATSIPASMQSAPRPHPRPAQARYQPQSRHPAAAPTFNNVAATSSATAGMRTMAVMANAAQASWIEQRQPTMKHNQVSGGDYALPQSNDRWPRVRKSANPSGQGLRSIPSGCANVNDRRGSWQNVQSFNPQNNLANSASHLNHQGGTQMASSNTSWSNQPYQQVALPHNQLHQQMPSWSNQATMAYPNHREYQQLEAPSSRNVYQQMPPQSNQVYQPIASSSNQVHQPIPSSSNQVYQPVPPTNIQIHQQIPSSSNWQVHQQMPRPSHHAYQQMATHPQPANHSVPSFPTAVPVVMPQPQQSLPTSVNPPAPRRGRPPKQAATYTSVPGLYKQVGRNSWVCQFQLSGGGVCGQPMRNTRSLQRHIGVHGWWEWKEVAEGRLSEELAIAMPHMEFLEYTCEEEHCGFREKWGKNFWVWDTRVDTLKERHIKMYHPELIQTKRVIGKRKRSRKEPGGP